MQKQREFKNSEIEKHKQAKNEKNVLYTQTSEENTKKKPNVCV